MFWERPRIVSNMHFFVSCQIDVVNKQLFSPISWNNPLSKLKFHQALPFSNIDFSLIEDILHPFRQVQPSQTYFTKTTEKLTSNSHKHFYDN